MVILGRLRDEITYRLVSNQTFIRHRTCAYLSCLLANTRLGEYSRFCMQQPPVCVSMLQNACIPFGRRVKDGQRRDEPVPQPALSLLHLRSYSPALSTLMLHNGAIILDTNFCEAINPDPISNVASLPPVACENEICSFRHSERLVALSVGYPENTRPHLGLQLQRVSGVSVQKLCNMSLLTS